MIARARFHGRGGQGAKTASRILGNAGLNAGLNVQDFPLYGAERRGAPVTAFTRISDGEILERGYVFDPDVSVVMDESLLDDVVADPIAGLRKGGVLLVNTPHAPGAVIRARNDMTVSTVDLTSLALKVLGKPILSAASAAAAARILSIPEESLLKAVAEELGEIGIGEDLVAKNIELAKVVYAELKPAKLETTEAAADEALVPMTVILSGNGSQEITSPGNSFLRRTGDWRTFRPVIDYAKCTDCMVCYVYCPESAMSVGENGRVTIDYDNCKGCMICLTECPLKAIAKEQEVFLR